MGRTFHNHRDTSDCVKNEGVMGEGGEEATPPMCAPAAPGDNGCTVQNCQRGSGQLLEAGGGPLQPLGGPGPTDSQDVPLQGATMQEAASSGRRKNGRAKRQVRVCTIITLDGVFFCRYLVGLETLVWRDV